MLPLVVCCTAETVVPLLSYMIGVPGPEEEVPKVLMLMMSPGATAAATETAEPFPFKL